METTQIENLSQKEKDKAIKSARAILRGVTMESAAKKLGIPLNEMHEAFRDIFHGG